MTQFKIDREQSVIENLKPELDRRQPNVVILDCLNPFLSEEESEHTYSRAADTVSMLQREYASIGMSFIVIHHMREPPQGFDPLSWYNIRGHGKLVDWPATRIMMIKRPVGKESKLIAKLTMRFMLRHGADPGDIHLSVKKDFHITRSTGLASL